MDFDDKKHAVKTLPPSKFKISKGKSNWDFNNIFDKLNPEQKEKTLEFIRHLLQKKKKKNSKGFTFSWGGALENLREKYSSVELQHKSMEWR